MVSFPAEPVTFEKGLIGFTDYHAYGLMALPDERLSQFRLLQSVDNPDLSFLLLPLDIHAGIIQPTDWSVAFDSLELTGRDVLAFAIVTLREGTGAFSATVNLRAPVIVDPGRNSGFQHVFACEDYPIRHPLG